MLMTSGVAVESVGADGLRTSVTGRRLPAPEIDIAEILEEPPVPEPLAPDRFRTAVWLIPASLSAGLALWEPTAMARSAGSDGALDGIAALWLTAVGTWGWFTHAFLAICAGAGAALVAVLGTEFGGRRAGILAGLLYALLPAAGAIVLGPTIVLVDVSLAATLLALRLAGEPKALRATAYAVTLVVLGLLSPPALVVALPHGLFAFLRGRPAGRWALLWSLAIAVAIATIEVLGVVEGWHPTTAFLPVESGWAGIALGGPVFVVVLVAMSLAGLSVRADAGMTAVYAIGSTAALVVVAVAVMPAAVEVLPVVVPAWCLLAGIALARVRMARAGCVVVVIAMLGVPGQVLFRHPDLSPTLGWSAASASTQFSGVHDDRTASR